MEVIYSNFLLKFRQSMTNHVKFTEGMFTKKHVLVKKKQMYSKSFLYDKHLGEKAVYEVEILWLFSKQKVSVAAVLKKGHERTHDYCFLWKDASVNMWFLLPTPKAKFTLFIEWPSYNCFRFQTNVGTHISIIIIEMHFPTN